MTSKHAARWLALALTLSAYTTADELAVVHLPMPELQSSISDRIDSADLSGPLQGLASWYGKGFKGRRTSSGERFQTSMLTAAHRSLPLGSLVEVSVVGTDRRVVVRINDRGPHNRHRIIDLSYAAAQALGITHQGVARVEIRPIQATELGPVVATLDGHSCNGSKPQLDPDQDP